MSESDGQRAGDQRAGAGQASSGGIPPSFGSASSPPPAPADGVTSQPPPAPPSGPASLPAAGPFAKPSAPPRRGLAGLTPPRLPRLPGKTPARGSSRSTRTNVMLFGFGPLALASLIVAAFVLVSPGKGSAASSAGFQAGPAVSTSPSAASATASPSPSSSRRARTHHHGRVTPSPAATVKVTPKTAVKAKAAPRPAHGSGGGRVAPHDLGVPDFARYCQHTGQRTAELTASNAYGWHCTLNPSRVLQVARACAWTYHLSLSQVINVSANYYDPNAWQCWRISRDLGVLNVARYCAAAGHGTSKLVADNAYGWYCTSPSAPVNTTAACDSVYHVSDAVSRFAVFADPYSWQCWN